MRNISADVRHMRETGGNLKQIEKELKENVRLRVSTAETFENTAENPELILESSWDLSQVNREKQGVYKVTGSFVIPEGYEVADSLALPEAYALSFCTEKRRTTD